VVLAQNLYLGGRQVGCQGCSQLKTRLGLEDPACDCWQETNCLDLSVGVLMPLWGGSKAVRRDEEEAAESYTLILDHPSGHTD
jgi:hypothetical protein